jgi:hypothetical protein
VVAWLLLILDNLDWIVAVVIGVVSISALIGAIFARIADNKAKGTVNPEVAADGSAEALASVSPQAFREVLDEGDNELSAMAEHDLPPIAAFKEDVEFHPGMVEPVTHTATAHTPGSNLSVQEQAALGTNPFE